ncbi:hypothetical protein DFH09DRAFT_1078430 [Mycena vulgaris]|nr:hypothetical protein DFH09DRAFT_1078430 [Mycena vulgaris]
MGAALAFDFGVGGVDGEGELGAQTIASRYAVAPARKCRFGEWGIWGFGRKASRTEEFILKLFGRSWMELDGRYNRSSSPSGKAERQEFRLCFKTAIKSWILVQPAVVKALSKSAINLASIGGGHQRRPYEESVSQVISHSSNEHHRERSSRHTGPVEIAAINLHSQAGHLQHPACIYADASKSGTGLGAVPGIFGQCGRILLAGIQLGGVCFMCRVQRIKFGRRI